MNIIINKFDLPCDIKNELYKYCYDRLGYTVSDITRIKDIKKNRRQKFIKLRVKLELAEWYKYNVSVSWLRIGVLMVGNILQVVMVEEHYMNHRNFVFIIVIKK